MGFDHVLIGIDRHFWNRGQFFSGCWFFFFAAYLFGSHAEAWEPETNLNYHKISKSERRM